MFHEIRHNNELLAIVITHRFSEPGVHFFTPGELSQQLAYIRHPAGKRIEAHVHNAVARQVKATQETLFIKRGKLRVDFFDNQRTYLQSTVLEAGDAILLVGGGHGFEVLEELEMYEVKQGPYAGDQDKTLFQPDMPRTLKFFP